MSYLILKIYIHSFGDLKKDLLLIKTSSNLLRIMPSVNAVPNNEHILLKITEIPLIIYF